MIDVRVYLELEAQLIRRLRKTWMPLAAKLQAQVVEAVNAGDFATAYDIASTLDLSSVGEKNKQYIKYMLLATANFGARMVNDSKTTFVSNATPDDMLEKITTNFCRSIELNATQQTYRTVMQSIAEAEQAASEATKAEKPRYVKEFVDFTTAGDEALQLISSLHSTRLTVWGFAAEAEVLGLTTYKLSAVLDGRTSNFCRTVNGKVFQVEDARRSINTILSVENPDDVKTIQPWPKQDKASLAEFDAMSAADLTARGFHIPPFHPRCRTMLVREGKVFQRTKPVLLPDEKKLLPPEIATPETFKELGLDITGSALTHWNSHVGVSPILALAKLSGYTPKEILDGVLGKLFKKIVVTEAGDIKFVTQRLLAGKAKAGSNLVFDPYNGTMHLNSVEFKNVPTSDALKFLKTTIGGALDIAESVGATTLVITVGGESGAFMFAKAGLVPSPSDWYDLKEAMISGLESGALKAVSDSLSPSQMKLLRDILNSKSQDSITVLASLPFKIGGEPIGKYLLKGAAYDAYLDLTNASKVAKFKDLL